MIRDKLQRIIPVNYPYNCWISHYYPYNIQQFHENHHPRSVLLTLTSFRGLELELLGLMAGSCPATQKESGNHQKVLKRIRFQPFGSHLVGWLLWLTMVHYAWLWLLVVYFLVHFRPKFMTKLAFYSPAILVRWSARRFNRRLGLTSSNGHALHHRHPIPRHRHLCPT